MRTGIAYCYAIALLSFLFLLLLSPAYAQTSGAPPTPDGTSEQRAARAFEKARANPLELRAFLVRMPKGGDLHNHLDGAVYAESRIRAGAEDNLCVAVAGLSFVKAERLIAKRSAHSCLRKWSGAHCAGLQGPAFVRRDH